MGDNLMYTYGLMFYVPINTIYFLILLISGIIRRKRKEYYVFALIFCIYMNVVIEKAFFPIFTDGARFYVSLSKNINLDVSTLFAYTSYQIIGNFLMTFPMGILLTFIINARARTRILCSVLFSILIEFIQFLMIVSLHLIDVTFDINDIILNVAGCLCGHLVFYLFCKIYIRIQGNACSISIIKYFNRACENCVHKRSSLDGLMLGK